jgi:transaldolase
MKLTKLNTKIFLDSGDPNQTKEVLDMFEYLDGQTTNPSLFAKNPAVKARIDAGEKFSKEEIYEAYKEIVQDIRTELPVGSISIEVYADADTSTEEMVQWGREMNTWIDGAHIKLPTIANGLAAAEQLTMEGINVNMTLVFSQEQAAAVYAATSGLAAGTSVFLSPFIGRLDDIGEYGVSLIDNILHSYQDDGDGHVEVLSASIRSLDHLMAMFALECDIVTVPYKILIEWIDASMPLPDRAVPFALEAKDLKPILPEQMDLKKDWREYNIQHDLTDQGLVKFAADWNALLV